MVNGNRTDIEQMQETKPNNIHADEQPELSELERELRDYFEMGRSPCCEKVGLKKGPWTAEEDQMLLVYIEEHGHGSWRSLPAKADSLSVPSFESFTDLLPSMDGVTDNVVGSYEGSFGENKNYWNDELNSMALPMCSPMRQI
ncbi:unnamed protein product [Fraxinus pennsylvanica]|uniref:Uncharacterized protein n=1 Tax=Fraxinus pennsylvanica TaxID=56036 RepID=A0AAD2ABU0_9LAMI|nr:unnamed protein product [Fraxinus pennsylvanica]